MDIPVVKVDEQFGGAVTWRIHPIKFLGWITPMYFSHEGLGHLGRGPIQPDPWGTYDHYGY